MSTPLSTAWRGAGGEVAPVLRYHAGHASLGRSSDMLTQAHPEKLYRWRLQAAGPQAFIPS